jgi:hypothetical protein
VGGAKPADNRGAEPEAGPPAAGQQAATDADPDGTPEASKAAVVRPRRSPDKDTTRRGPKKLPID